MHTIYIDGIPLDYQSFKFSGGEVHVKLGKHPGDIQWGEYGSKLIRILAHLRNSDSIMELLLLTDALRNRYGSDLYFEVQMPYIPYARQDRVCAEGEALSLRVFADLINSQNYDKVIVWDVHSDVAPALIRNCVSLHQKIFVDRCFGINKLDKSRTILVSPDGGALKKIMDVAQWIRITDIVRADKKRDVNTGAITGTVVYSQNVGDKDFLIVDDLIDAGRTFIELAKVLKPLTTGKIFLYATHGIFSAGLDGLLGHIDHIYVANSFIKSDNDRMTEISL